MVSNNRETKELALGMYLPDVIPGVGSYAAFENLLATKISLISFYWSWGLGNSETPFGWTRAILDENKSPLITWEPWVIPPDFNNPASSISDKTYKLSSIIDGRFDNYIRFWAKGLKTIEGEILLRPMHEMNGNWYPWCGVTNGNRPEEFVLAWRHLRHVLTEEGLSHVKWVWCPYALSVPRTSENEISCYYPGDRYVDWMALDGYNWGDTRDWSCWQTFDEVFAAAYRIVADLNTKPIMIAEMGCAESGGSKAKWIRDTLASIQEGYPRLRAVTWFNANKECDWRIESSETSLSSFRAGWSRKERLL